MSERVSYRVTLGDQQFDVTIDSGTAGLVVEVEGQRLPVAWAALDADSRVLTLGAASHSVLVAPADEGCWVAADGYQADARVLDARALQLAAALPKRAGVAGRTEVRAPMPGRVARVAVEPGAAVERGGLLLTLEAMKMENELRAPQTGVVAQVAVEAGAAVERNALLVVLAPPDAPAAHSV